MIVFISSVKTAVDANFKVFIILDILQDEEAFLCEFFH